VATGRRGAVGRAPAADAAEADGWGQAPRPLSGVQTVHAALWCLIVTVSPLYILSPGLPQPFHLLVVIAMAAGMMVLLPLILPDRDLIISLWAFLGYVTLVNSIWYALIEDGTFLLSTLYLTFNVLVFWYVVALVRLIGTSVIALTAMALTVGIALEIFMITTGLSELHPSGGALGSFTNPNQLGHWAVLAVAAILIVKKDRSLTVADAAAIGAAIILTFLSLSRAGLVSMALLVAVGGLVGRKTIALKAGLVVVIAAMLIAAFFYADDGLESIGLQPAGAELARHTPWDSPEGRGYDRIWVNPQYLLLGAGEGGFERFARAPLFFYNELHSSFGTIIFSYGVIGAALLSVFFVALFRKTDLRTLMIFAPLFLFGFVHNTFRFSFFWMVLGLAYAVHGLHSQPRPAAEPALRRTPAFLQAAEGAAGRAVAGQRAPTRRTRRLARPGPVLQPGGRDG
jgi:hypothetical protein